MLKRLGHLQLAAKHILVIVLLVIHLSPIWIFKFFPTQDGLSHIYNAQVLKDYHRHENYTIRDVYRLNLTLFPNWMSHALMASPETGKCPASIENSCPCEALQKTPR